VDDIRVTQKAAGKEAECGELDARFERAMGYFWSITTAPRCPCTRRC